MKVWLLLCTDGDFSYKTLKHVFWSKPTFEEMMEIDYLQLEFKHSEMTSEKFYEKMFINIGESCGEVYWELDYFIEEHERWETKIEHINKET